MSWFEKALQRAADVYDSARAGEAKSLAIESVVFGVQDQYETFGVLSYDDLNNDSVTKPIADFLADGLGFTLSDLGLE